MPPPHPLPKGSILIADGQGNVSFVQPGNDGETLIFDSSNNSGMKFDKTVANGFLKFPITAKSTFNTKNYETALTFAFPGSDTGSVEKIQIISDMSNNATSYSVRLYDLTHDEIIAENTFNNKTPQINDLTPILYLPETESIVELQLKLDSGSTFNRTIFVRELNIKYR